MKTSKGEEKIIELLKKGGYKFEREKRFNNFKKGRYRFDFYVEGVQPVILEVQGKQHYQFVAKFHKTYLDLTAAQERDRRKISYCLAHKIPIYCIPYWELDSLTSAADLFQEKFRARDQWKNDKDYQKKIAKDRAKREFDTMIQRVIK